MISFTRPSTTLRRPGNEANQILQADRRGTSLNWQVLIGRLYSSYTKDSNIKTNNVGILSKMLVCKDMTLCTGLTNCHAVDQIGCHCSV